MQDSTFNKILSDPNFDPHGIIEDALVEYIKNHPEEVAKDRVALRWLVLDSTILGEIVNVIDINDIEMITPFVNTINKPSSDGWSKENTIKTLIKKLDRLKPENVDQILKIIAGACGSFNPSQLPTTFVNSMSVEQINWFVDNAVRKGAEVVWTAADWDIVTRTKMGTTAFVNCFSAGRMPLTKESFQIISKCAKAIQVNAGCLDNEEKRMMIRRVDQDWQSYVCYKCSCGTNVGRFSRRGTNPDTNVIKSISGYTLHRQKCDPQNLFPSPHEVFFGKPKTLSFECHGCGEVFTTTSGLTLHRKSCNR
jgi:hypothetical protein